MSLQSHPVVPTERETAEALAQVEAEPLLPIEKQLIFGSLALGAALLGVLLWVSATYFPSGH
ncbi:hypothetical protein [Fimbriiglobus ruber]|uniref:Uncharacterized protein n=1 Tax=Fimbriiglobus ruber TaxID=1908690 RepID=A0A225DGF9_9BACT|nr:hypothetical protein [Fimbriiglobus ruber]OWK36259.1 hypothetical protein FRUB_08822 [Fimbriiglobus ruber]